MFTFTKLFWHNTQNQKPKLFAITLIGFAILLLLTVLAMSPYTLLLQVWQMSLLTGQQNLTTLILMMVGAIILTICLFTMLIFPFFVGVIRAIYHGISDTTHVRWKDLFGAFKKGVWGKSVIVGILLLLFIVLMAIIYALVNAGMTYIVQHIFNWISGTGIGQGVLQVIVSILIVLISFVLSIVIWFAALFITNVAVSLNEDASRTMKIHFKEAWSGIKNGKKTFFRFLIGILLLNLIFIILNEPINFLIQQSLAHMSQNLAYTLLMILNVVFLLIRYFIYFLIIGTVVQYFVRRGRKEEHV
ncbi:lytic transglycosylase [Staphylococcus cornubiensis]|uniref:lytic transglycosylase n=1 Tax=Staphylococcus cornubiensis TaxID=1986155 RepID=UPI000A3AEE32|nr:lytic transglycosylase [Staphylococcus cornubiensis]